MFSPTGFMCWTTVYALAFQEVIENPSLSVSTHGETGNQRNTVKTNLHGFADDHALKKSFQAKSWVAEQTSIKLLENTAIDVKSWMDENWLCMNDGKTEFIYVWVLSNAPTLHY